MTNLSERPTILVVGADETQLAAKVDVLRKEGWLVLGTSDAWQAITLVSQLELGMILVDLDLAGLGALDFSRILAEDPGLNDIPMIQFFGDCRDEDLLRTVRGTLPMPFPSDEPEGGTRFVTRRRPAAILA